MKKILSKHLVEIRYTPNARILDKRGETAESLSSALLNYWNISTNRIDFLSKDNESVRAFFSYKNLGFLSSYPNETDYFIEESKNLIKSAWTHFPADKIRRIGVRSTYAIPVKDFTIAFETYKDKFLKLSDADIKQFGGDLVDIGFPLNFVSGENFFNIVTGPMEKEQLKQFFGDIDDLPDSAIYIDVDYFRKDFSSEMRQRNVLEFIENGVKRAKSISDTISSLVATKN
ncbi:MAG: hypothetical protein WDZ80_04450 [Candidatus Paceibacterota bacterium]